MNSNTIAKAYPVTVSADDSVNAVVFDTFTITVTIPNSAPVITNPGNKSYDQGEAIAAFSITVTDAEDIPTVILSGLPFGLVHTPGQVSGTIDSDATAKDYAVNISANDRSNPAVSATFTITVLLTISPSETCTSEWFIDEILNLSEERESSFSPRILKLYSDKIEEVERTTKILRCETEPRWRQVRHLSLHDRP